MRLLSSVLLAAVPLAALCLPVKPALAEECITDILISSGGLDVTLPVIGTVTLPLPVIDVTPGSDGASSSGAGSLACGPSAAANGIGATALGDSATVNADGGTAAGEGAQIGAGADNASVFGQGASAGAGATGASVFGQGASAAAAGGVAVGQGASVGAGGTNSVAVGAGAQANHANAAAFGAGAQTQRDNQFVYGSGANTHTMAGVTSAASLAAQSGPIELVTTDASGNLATDGGQFVTILNNLVTMVDNSQQVETNRRAIERNTEGIAMAFAMAGMGSILPDSRDYALSAQWGHFAGMNSLALGGAARLSYNSYLSGSLGVGLDSGRVGGRAGMTVAW